MTQLLDSSPSLYYLKVLIESKKPETRLVTRRVKLWTEDGNDFKDLSENLDEFGEPSLEYLNKKFNSENCYETVISGEIKLYCKDSIEESLNEMHRWVEIKKIKNFVTQPPSPPKLSAPPTRRRNPPNQSDPSQVLEENLSRLLRFYETISSDSKLTSTYKVQFRSLLFVNHRYQKPYSELYPQFIEIFGSAPEFLEVSKKNETSTLTPSEPKENDYLLPVPKPTRPGQMYPPYNYNGAKYS